MYTSNSNLPKGMSMPESTETPEQKPVFLTLMDVNYVGMIRQALANLPLELVITKCAIEESDKNPSIVHLVILVLSKKEINYQEVTE